MYQVLVALCDVLVPTSGLFVLQEFEAFPYPSGLLKAVWVSAMGYFAGNQFEVHREITAHAPNFSAQFVPGMRVFRI